LSFANTYTVRIHSPSKKQGIPKDKFTPHRFQLIYAAKIRLHTSPEHGGKIHEMLLYQSNQNNIKDCKGDAFLTIYAKDQVPVFFEVFIPQAV